MKIAIVGLGRVGSRSLQKLAPRLSAQDELVLVDRDVLEEGNLRGCEIYGANAIGKLKAPEAAGQIKGLTKAKINCFAEHLGKNNAAALLAVAGLVFDCSDNWQTRMVLNEYCWPRGIPWVYAGALQSHAMASTIVPGKTPCFACWARPAGTVSCSQVGVENAASEKAAEKQAGAALELIAGREPNLSGKLYYFNSGSGFETEFVLEKSPWCAFCSGGRSLLEEGEAVQLCGSREWQFLNSWERIGVEKIFRKLEGTTRERFGDVVKAHFDGGSATIFPNSRVVVRAGEKKKAVEINQIILQKIS